MKSQRVRKRKRRRKCRNCGELYRANPRSQGRQKYCSAPECRKASQAESWRKWFNRPENRDYYMGARQVARTQAWRQRNPCYWRKRSKETNALPKVCLSQSIDNKADTCSLTPDALPKGILSQPALIVGLIANLTGSALPKDIAESSRQFLHLGQDILGTEPGNNPNGGRYDGKADYMPATATQGSQTV